MALFLKSRSPAVVSVQGEPVCSFEFTGLPSINTHYGMHWRVRHVPTAEWRYEAKYAALDWIDHNCNFWEDTPIINRAFVLIRVFPPYEEISDIHNVYAKAVLDGFTDAGIWADDEWAYVPLFAFVWAGIGQHKPRERTLKRSVFDIYELESLLIQGQEMQLPKGRRRI